MPLAPAIAGAQSPFGGENGVCLAALDCLFLWGRGGARRVQCSSRSPSPILEVGVAAGWTARLQAEALSCARAAAAIMVLPFGRDAALRAALGGSCSSITGAPESGEVLVACLPRMMSEQPAVHAAGGRGGNS